MFQPGPVRIGNLQLELGERANPGAPVATTTFATRIVTLDLDADRQDVLAVGDAVGIELPDGTQTTGSVREIGSVATSQDGGTPQVSVTIELDDPASTGTLDGAPVTISVVRDRREDVMAVPVESLLALREGGYAVQVVDSSGGSHLVGVDLGLFEDGWVQVSGNLSVGDDVAVPS